MERTAGLSYIFAALLTIFLSTGCAIGATGDGPIPTETETRTPIPTLTPTATSTPASLPDRRDCDEVRGTRYRSPSERVFYLSNCLSSTVTPPPAVIVDGDPPAPSATPAVPNAPPLSGGVTAIGDSVMLGAEAQVRAAIPGVDVHAMVGVQASTAIELLRQLTASGRLGSKVVIHIGSNGTFTANQFDQMMALLADVDRVVFLNVRVDRSWQDPNNAMLGQRVPTYANARLVDWYGATAGHPNYFWNDGIHLRPEGAQTYAALIAGNL